MALILYCPDQHGPQACFVVNIDLVIFVPQIDMDLELPKSKDSMGGLKAILTNLEILLFLVTLITR